MAILAIKGHPTRGSEVIALLEMLGGVNIRNLYGDENYSHYTINDNKEIIGSLPTDKFVFFTLERFLEKFPYKVGDKVNSPCKGCIKTVTSMGWDTYLNTVTYKLDNRIYTNIDQLKVVNDLQLYKEETMERKDYNPITLIPVLDKVMIIPTDEESEIVQKNNKFYLVKKQPQYPKTYEECCEILKINYPYFKTEEDGISASTYKNKLFGSQKQLLICRDAYWKIAGEQIGLGKPWKPDWCDETEVYYTITYNGITFRCYNATDIYSKLSFPTKEMRDAFYKNFNVLIEQCKEFI